MMPLTVPAADFREAMSSVGAAVNVITTAFAGQRVGFTATAVCSVSDDPATLLFCVNNRSNSLQTLLSSKLANINTLRAEECGIADVFSGRTATAASERFSIGDWETASNGCPMLRTALAGFECRIIEAKLVNTHHVFFACVSGVYRGQPGPALIYQNRSYKVA
jgi:flavin reductase (DIM6/NTAB) family NADH-FMN oxidoreductase RutF